MRRSLRCERCLLIKALLCVSIKTVSNCSLGKLPFGGKSGCLEGVVRGGWPFTFLRINCHTFCLNWLGGDSINNIFIMV